MKKLFILLAAVAVCLTYGCTKEYDDSALNNRINSLEQRLSALETVMQAYQNNLYIKSVQHTGDMCTITFSDGSTAIISNGKDGEGEDGDTLISCIVAGESEVTFVLTDGREFSIAVYSALSIDFDETDLIVMSPNSTREIHYTVKSNIQDVEVETVSSADIKAKVVATSKAEGAIEISTGAAIDEYSKVVVFVSNGEKVIMRRLSFEEAGLQVEDNATKNASSEGGEMALEFLSNVKCEVVIPDDAKSWISVVPDTRALERQTVTLKLEPNTGYYRSATVTIQSPDGALNLEYLVEQEGEQGIDPEAVPDNEIWYVTNDAYLFYDRYSNFEQTWGHLPFDRSIIAHIYQNGYGRIKFDGPVTEINSYAFYSIKNLVSVYLPSSIKKISGGSFELCTDLRDVYINGTNLSIDLNPFDRCDKLQRFYGPCASEDGRCLIVDDTLYSFAPYELSEYTIPQGVKTIGMWACNRSELKKVIIPEGVERIERNAFGAEESNSIEYKESFLEYVYLPSTLDFLDSAAFLFNKNIKAFYGNTRYVSDDNMALFDYGRKCLISFASGAGLTEYTIPEGVVGISSFAFYYATSLKKLHFPDSFCGCSSAAFDGTNIEEITGKYVLDDKRSMVIDGTLVMFAGGNLQKYTTPQGVSVLGYQVLGYNDNVTEYVISDEVIYAERYGYMFHFCPNLETITISARMEYLGGDPFVNVDRVTPKLKTVYCRAIIPPLVYYSDYRLEQGDFNFNDLTIYVPEESLAAYKSSPYWTPYRDYIKGYHYTDLPEIDAYVSTDYSQDGKVTTIRTATKGNGIDIVLMGDAFSDRQIADGTYMKTMQSMADKLFTVEPYKSFKDMFNVYAVNVVSATEGYDYGNSALHGFFGGGTYVGGDDNACFEYALKAISEDRMDEALIVVAMNEDAYAGTCYMYYPSDVAGIYGSGPSVAYFPTSSDAETFTGLIHHEALGHGFPKLADEYAYEDMGTVPADYAAQTKTQQNDWGWWKNVDFTSDPASIRWNYFLSDSRYDNEGLGAYEGGLTYWSGVWRPTENSIMRYNSGGFNAPSREAIYYRIHKLAYGDSWEYKYEDFVKYDEINRRDAGASGAQAYRPAIHKPTHPPVIVNKSWRDAE